MSTCKIEEAERRQSHNLKPPLQTNQRNSTMLTITETSELSGKNSLYPWMLIFSHSARREYPYLQWQKAECNDYAAGLQKNSFLYKHKVKFKKQKDIAILAQTFYSS